MTGWIDPLGVRCLMRYIDDQQIRLEGLIEVEERLHPTSRRLSKYRGRYNQLSRLKAITHAVLRPGGELQPYKSLVNANPKADEIRLLISQQRRFVGGPIRHLEDDYEI